MSMLKQIDNFFQNRKSSEKILIYFTIAIAIFAFSYQYFFPMSEKMYKNAAEQKKVIETKINLDRAYIKAVTVNGDENFYIKKYDKDLQNLKEKYKQVIDKKRYIDYKIKELSYLLYNKKKWAEFFDSLTQIATRNGIEINYILNNFLDATKTFGHVLEVEISCKGDFKNIVAYINDIEQSDLVVDVYALHISGKSPLESIFKVSVWGINY
ncbi:hypothetical protein [Nitratiruptor tergarcus]|uniref:Type IV pilus assembly protein PilO n=1 Tax=Nitratiruptor tergarcus DSM 16512 TaxID=1069081 RepID=A0A1W1WTJ2_9BACT|nr:hypothetical protein [Nitratiruptor tergarcus]SMC09634.1 hypothetical protein SAMN05660197_1455 [Nitratiruptor tergarcus DSM 16512]